ncbi:MAG TPA: DUF2252 family protein [Vicinamibacterales bacterium]|nr:DUF2252 family protein [Vicinamibacterales bacterium]
MTGLVESTQRFERWLAQQTPIVRPDLALKHERMAESPFVLLRGTFYRWVELFAERCPSAFSAPVIPVIGDLHVENFGTWRDSEGRVAWGVNDVDEACVLPYTNDLVRLATSAVLAGGRGKFELTPRDICGLILDGYLDALDEGGDPVVLAERRRWMRKIIFSEQRDPRVFWPKLAAGRRASGAIPNAVLKASMPDPDITYRVVKRVAGVGSLGRQRFVALAEWRGALVAREVKAWVPSAATWATGKASAGYDGMTLLAKAVRAPDPFYATRNGWVVRRLAPDCSRIELEELPDERDEERLLRTMGWETANIHLGKRAPGVRVDLKSRPKRWLESAALTMAEFVDADWREWKRG